MERNWKPAVLALVVVAAVSLLFVMFNRSDSEDPTDVSSQGNATGHIEAPPTTSPTTSRAPIEEEILPSRNTYPTESSTTTSGPPPDCMGDSCHGEGLPPQGNWEEVLKEFTQAYGHISHNTKEQWLDGISPYITPTLRKKLEPVEIDSLKPGGKPEIIVTDKPDRSTVIARVNYPEGWSIYIRASDLGTSYGGWKIDTINTPRGE